MKTCTKCKELRPKTEFSKRASARDGLSYLCRSCDSSAKAQWGAANQDKLKAYQAAYRAANLAKAKATNAAWVVANRDRVNANVAKWKAANPESRCLHEQNRRARKREAGGKLSSGLADKLLKLQRGKCACCHVSLDDGYHLDHVIPLALDGPNTDDNMQLLCAPCNLSKAAKHPIDFMQQRGLLL